MRMTFSWNGSDGAAGLMLMVNDYSQNISDPMR